jgi:hypothetical protein
LPPGSEDLPRPPEALFFFSDSLPMSLLLSEQTNLQLKTCPFFNQNHARPLRIPRKGTLKLDGIRAKFDRKIPSNPPKQTKSKFKPRIRGFRWTQIPGRTKSRKKTGASEEKRKSKPRGTERKPARQGWEWAGGDACNGINEQTSACCCFPLRYASSLPRPS